MAASKRRKASSKVGSLMGLSANVERFNAKPAPAENLAVEPDAPLEETPVAPSALPANATGAPQENASVAAEPAVTTAIRGSSQSVPAPEPAPTISHDGNRLQDKPHLSDRGVKAKAVAPSVGSEANNAVPAPAAARALRSLDIEVTPLGNISVPNPMDSNELMITQTDLEVEGGGGVYDLYTTNLDLDLYPKGVGYNELLPMDISKGFAKSLRPRTISLTPNQVSFYKKQSARLNRLWAAHSGASEKVVRTVSKTALLRLMLDFFIQKSPSDTFDDVKDEQSFRGHLGIPPLPELEIYEHEIKKTSSAYGALRRKLDGTDFRPGLIGVFDDWPTRFSDGYRRGVTYNDLADIKFTTGFHSGMVRVNAAFTELQDSQFESLSAHLSRKITDNRDDDERAFRRKSSVSMLTRTIFDFFYVHARPDEFLKSWDEQSLRSCQGVQPLPELDLFIHERLKLR